MIPSDRLSWRTIQNSKQNHIVARQGESLKHFLGKCQECWFLHAAGKVFYTEAEFKNKSGRADIYCLTDDEAVEIVLTETEESLARKQDAYPCSIRVVRVKLV